MKVIVVGGGAAGIAAAYTLLAGGAQVSLYEARNRFGGRAYTNTGSIPNFAFDMGPVYLQDPSENPWKAIAETLQFTTAEEKDPYYIRMKNPDWKRDKPTGPNNPEWENTAPDLVPGVYTEKERIEASFEQRKEQNNMPPIYRPNAESDDYLYACAATQYGPIAESAELWQYIAKDRDRQKDVEEEPNLFVKEGVGTLIKTHGEKLETLFPNQFKKSLSTPVTSIRWRPGSVEVRATGHPMESGDACLVTVPPPVLRNRDITFKPDLPFQHREAIGFLKLGSYKKIALVLTKVPNDIAMETYYLRIQQNPNGVWVYYRSPFSPNVLVAHAAGEFAAALDHKRNDVVVKMLKTTLRACYGGIVFAETSAVTNWNADKFARGAYSYTAPKTDFDRWPGRVFDSDASFNGLNADDRESIEEDVTAYEARVRFREPVGQTLWFAGEATDTDFYGTIAGAYNEGVRAATEILNGASVSNKKK